MDHIEISKTSGAEFISHQLLKFVVNPNPMAALVNGFCDYLNLLQINNIIDVLNELKEKIDFVITWVWAAPPTRETLRPTFTAGRCPA